ncbi:MAG: BrnT family toxin [Candidatus Aminicenantales bacterium]
MHTIQIKYSWDPAKACSNFRKHGVRFSDLEPVFEDEMAIVIDEIVRGEERSVIVGMDGLARILVVVYAKRGDEMRIISARKAYSRNENDMG